MSVVQHNFRQLTNVLVEFKHEENKENVENFFKTVPDISDKDAVVYLSLLFTKELPAFNITVVNKYLDKKPILQNASLAKLFYQVFVEKSREFFINPLSNSSYSSEFFSVTVQPLPYISYGMALSLSTKNLNSFGLLHYYRKVEKDFGRDTEKEVSEKLDKAFNGLITYCISYSTVYSNDVYELKAIKKKLKILDKIKVN